MVDFNRIREAQATPAPAGSDVPAILIVDDNPANVVALEAVLQPLGYELERALSGEEALLKSLQRDFVLIIMDVHMPTLDGYQVVELLRTRARSREVPIVFLTAVYGLQEHVHRGYALGAADFITKPFDPVVVRAKVSALVTLYTRGQRNEQARRQEMDRIKDLLFGAVGHDLRNPLSMIVMGARLLKNDAGNADYRRDQVEVIERAALRMSRIVDDILDLTAGKFAGAIALKLEAVDLASVCRNVVAETRSAHPGRSIELDFTGDVTGEWDASRLARIVANLVDNAVHHAREACVQVALVGDGSYVSIVVRNDGPGIAPETLASLFEPFRRGDTTAEGLGLGLYIVREIARAHGGDVEVNSSEAGGTTFIVSLPRRPPGRGQEPRSQRGS